MPVRTRPVLEINLQNLQQNYLTLQRIAKGATCAAVVKDDAYGLGADRVAPYLYQTVGCRHFFVAHAVEGAALAPLLPEAKIFVLQGIGEDSVELFEAHPNLIPVISCPEMSAYWQAHKTGAGEAVIHVDTGLNRLGFREQELARLSPRELSEFSMVMSHLACADEKDHFMNAYQLEHFLHIKETYFPKVSASLSASDGIFLGGDFLQDTVRLGAAMYGINTAPYRPNQMKSVVRLKAPVLQVEDLPVGQFVGYSATYRAATSRRIAIVSIGYGDGLPRAVSNVGKIFFIKGQKLYEARIIGRVSMDNTICDVTEIPNLCVGDEAILLDDFYTLDDLGRDGGTISYEVLSRIGKNPRFCRIYTE